MTKYSDQMSHPPWQYFSQLVNNQDISDLEQPIGHPSIRSEVASGYLPPLKAVKVLPKEARSLLRIKEDQTVSRQHLPLSLNKKLRDERFLSNYIKEERKKIDNFSVKAVEVEQQKKPVFRSAKVGAATKVKPIQIRPQLKEMKDQYRLREASIQRFLSEADILENYKMLSHLGRGSFSIVSLAVERSTQRRFAIKTYAKIDQIQNYKFDNIYREVSNLHNLNHQNVVGLYHVIKDKRKLLLVMEDGGKLSLAGLLRKSKTISEDDTRTIFRQLLEGIRYCHQQRVCHRDLKLENILIDSQNKVKIIDFGFSARCGEKLNNYCGTPPYMSPQIAAKVPYWGEQADMWALGVLLYLMLFGKFPFRANSEKQLYRLIQQGKFQMGEGVTAQAKTTISRLLKCNAKERASAEQILQGKWLKQLP